MAKKRVAKKVSSRSKINRKSYAGKKVSKNIPNPFNKVSFGSVQWTEKSIFMIIVLVLGVVAVINGNLGNSITGYSTRDVTGMEVVSSFEGTGFESVGTALGGVWKIINALATSAFNIFGASMDDESIMVIKLTLVIILYMILNMFLGASLGGRGSFISALLAFLIMALTPNQIIKVYLGELLPAAVTLILAFIVVLIGLYLVGKITPEERWGHILKGFLYAVILVMTLHLQNRFIKEDGLFSTSTMFAGLANWMFLILIVYIIWMIFRELLKIASARKARLEDIGEVTKKIGKTVDNVLGIPSRAKLGYREGRWGDKREVIAAVEEYLEEEKTNPSWAGMIGFLNKKLGTKSEKEILEKYSMTKKEWKKFQKKLERVQKNKKQDKKKAWG